MEARSPKLLFACLLAVLACSTIVQCDNNDTVLHSTSKPLIKRPEGSRYKTVLSVHGGGLKGMMVSTVVVEVEQSIKRYLFEHPEYFPDGADITTVDDFDINLVDYFDCLTGLATGAWITLYLASRGGQGASRAVLDDPAIVEKYGVIPTGGADGLRVFYGEFGRAIYNPAEINISAGTPLDLSNPAAPGVSAPIYSLSGLESTLESFYGDLTLADLEKTTVVSGYDLIRNDLVLFVKNAFEDPPSSSAARLVQRLGPKKGLQGFDRFFPDILFQEKNYYLSDIGAASGSTPIATPAKALSQVNNDTVEFLMINGLIAIEDPAIPTLFFIASETGAHDFADIAVISISSGVTIEDYAPFANSGLADWALTLRLNRLYNRAGRSALTSQLDYIFYANPKTRPNQYVRIQAAAPADTEDGMALGEINNAEFLDRYEEIGLRLADEHRPNIDAFVRDFIFS